MAERFDLAVIGGGPAGTSAAITAARNGHRVLLLERGSFPRHKVCGEFVSSESLELLGALLGPDHVWPNPPPEISRARIFLDGREQATEISPPAKSIPRYDMDVALWNAAKKSGVVGVLESAVREIAGDGPFSISTETTSIVAKAVINASGRWSNLGSQMKVPQLGASVGLKQHFHENSLADSVDLYFFQGGYCGVQPIARDEVNVSAMVLPSVAKTLDGVFGLEPTLKERSAGWKPTTEQVSTYPLVHGKPLPIDAQRNILNAGDAAGFIDPFVGDGISMALHSGKMAAECLDRFLRNDCSLRAAAVAYRESYEERLMPAFRNASRLRKLIASPNLRGLAMELFKIPAISRMALRSTRARTKA